MIKPPKFVSVGGNCQPVVHIRRASGGQEIPHVFDWLECSVAAVTTLVETEFEGFFTPDRLHFAFVDDALEVTDQSTGVVSRHNFKSESPQHVEQVVLSLRLMAKRFMRLLRSDEKVIFVRRWIEKDGGWRDEAARSLHRILQTHKPDCGFLYLQQYDLGPRVVDGNYVAAFNPATTTEEDWEGYEAFYDSNFACAVDAFESQCVERRRATLSG